MENKNNLSSYLTQNTTLGNNGIEKICSCFQMIELRSNTSVTIEGSSLKAGMYLYSLIADGKEVDTKKMILTK